jgi:hypothetical protein
MFCDLCAPSSMSFYAFSSPIRGWRKPSMKRRSVSIQPDLFGQDESHAVPTVSQMEALARLVEALLLEIAAALLAGEMVDDQDHG